MNQSHFDYKPMNQADIDDKNKTMANVWSALMTAYQENEHEGKHDPITFMAIGNAIERGNMVVQMRSPYVVKCLLEGNIVEVCQALRVVAVHGNNNRVKDRKLARKIESRNRAIKNYLHIGLKKYCRPAVSQQRKDLQSLIDEYKPKEYQPRFRNRRLSLDETELDDTESEEEEDDDEEEEDEEDEEEASDQEDEEQASDQDDLEIEF